MLRTAREWGMAPSEFLALPGWDRDAMLALHELEASTCKCGCGQPITESTSDDGPSYRVGSYVCRAGAELDRARSEKLEPGTLLWVAPERASEAERAAEMAAETQAVALLKATDH